MTVTNKDTRKNQPDKIRSTQPEATHSSQLPSSPGISPKEMTPKDVTPEHASWSDLKTRSMSSNADVQREESLLDDAIEQTFPASDPTADLPASPASVKTAWCIDEDEELLDEAIEMTFPASDPIAVTPHDKLAILPRVA